MENNLKLRSKSKSSKSEEPTESTESINSLKSSLSKIKIPEEGKKEFRKYQVLTLVIFLPLAAFYFIFNISCSFYESNQLKSYDYGEKVNVNGHNMVASISGEQNEPTIVLITGFGSPSPILHYKPLVETLADKYKIVVMEPFGYGLSDLVDEERTIDNIVTELHTGIQKLGIQQYYLMSHSMGGLYSLYWSNKYTDEVLGFIGLDITPPKAEKIVKHAHLVVKLLAIIDYFGFERMQSFSNNKNLLLPLSSSYDYTEEEIEMFRVITLQKGYNKLHRKEINSLIKNMSIVRDMKFPSNIPVLNFVCSAYDEIFSEWKQLHIDVGDKSISNDVIVVPGDHANFVIDQRETISKKIKSWIK